VQVDLNADVGESFGTYTIGCDAGLLRAVSSASIAAGFHAGDPTVLRQTLRLARAHGVAVGAHPGFPDLTGFGRREMHLAPAEVENLVLYQVAAVAGVANAEGLALQHVKPHGALYNMAARDRSLAAAVARGVAAFDRSLILFGPPGSELLAAGDAEGIRVFAEGFADRSYEPDGSLTPRQRPAAVIHDAEAILARTIRLLKEHTIEARDGSSLTLRVDTICVHGDTPGADVIAAALRAGLEAAGITVRSPAEQ
jgi:5-oxoprolinase (ATP-hydrolysing) subunit A